MAVNLLEEDHLVYHDRDAETLDITVTRLDQTDTSTVLIFTCFCGIMISVDRGAVETLRDALTCWLETGKLK